MEPFAKIVNGIQTLISFTKSFNFSKKLLYHRSLKRVSWVTWYLSQEFRVILLLRRLLKIKWGGGGGGEDKRGLHYCLVSFRWLKITKKHSYILQKNNKNVLQQNIITCSLRIYLYNTIPRNVTCTEKKYMNFT